MAKFTNKKEQVLDIKLTSYGHYLLSIGKFKPEYYAFYDNNIVYDSRYIGITEEQNDIQKRIKEDTQYLEGLVLFEDVEAALQSTLVQDADGTVSYYDTDITPTMQVPRKDSFRFTSMIGDAHLNSERQSAPAWKVVTLNGTILSSSLEDTKNNYNIPQINISLNYKKSVEPYSPVDVLRAGANARDVVATSKVFADNKVIKLLKEDLMIYAEEINTDVLSENFEVEIFEVDHDAIPALSEAGNATDLLKRLFFFEDKERIMGGIMGPDSQGYVDPLNTDAAQPNYNYTTASVGHYFDFVQDFRMNQEDACRASELFNKQSYYINLDFECDKIAENYAELSDLYGPVTEPEICP